MDGDGRLFVLAGVRKQLQYIRYLMQRAAGQGRAHTGTHRARCWDAWLRSSSRMMARAFHPESYEVVLKMGERCDSRDQGLGLGLAIVDELAMTSELGGLQVRLYLRAFIQRNGATHRRDLM